MANTRSRTVFAAALSLGLSLLLPAAHADDLLINGGFETGDLTGWTVRNLASGDPSGTFGIGNNLIDTNLTPNSPATPIGELASVGAKTGNYYAVSDSLGPGTHLLLQSFTVPIKPASVFLSYDMFVNDWNGAGALNADGPLDQAQVDGQSNLIPTQFARVDILRAAADAYSVNPADVLGSYYSGVDSGTPANNYTHYSFDITSITHPGSTYQLRFAEVDNQFSLNQGVDNVVVNAQTPEPGTIALFLALGLTAPVALRMRRRKTVSL